MTKTTNTGFLHNDAESIRIRHLIRGIVIRPAWAARMARKYGNGN